MMRKIERFLPDTVSCIHFVGIGGIGMSAIAEILAGLGYQVQGSDGADSKNVQRLRDQGITVHIGHDAAHVRGADVVVVSSAIKPANPEWQAARALHIPVVHRAEMLAELMRFHASVAVGGTHGKTTTTSFVYTVLTAAGIAPTVINGGILNALGTNARIGDGDWMVVEADESDGSFRHLRPTIAVVTNIEPEHMEHYGTPEKLHAAFRGFVESVPFYGLVVLCTEDAETRHLYNQITDRRVVSYGFHEEANYRAKNIRSEGLESRFDLHVSLRDSEEVIPDVTIGIPGRHNVLNALAAFAVADEMGVPLTTISQALASFAGVKRRFTILGQPDGITVVDDYGHHPTEITATLKTARQAFPDGQVLAIIQPHRYTRLKDHMGGFAQSAMLADKVIVVPVYAAGEEPIEGVNHEALAQMIRGLGHQHVHTAADANEVSALLHAQAHAGDGVIFLGAGSISGWAQDIVGRWHEV